jgi:hypothetical protein
MSEYTKALRTKLREQRASTQRRAASSVGVFKVAASMYKGRTFGDGNSGLHGAIQNDPRYKPNRSGGSHNMTPKQAAALRKAQKAAAIANRRSNIR